MTQQIPFQNVVLFRLLILDLDQARYVCYLFMLSQLSIQKLKEHKMGWKETRTIIY